MEIEVFHNAVTGEWCVSVTFAGMAWTVCETRDELTARRLGDDRHECRERFDAMSRQYGHPTSTQLLARSVSG